MLAINDITIRIAGRPLLEGASASIPAGAKTGLVGRNGSGKTTLFRAISGEIAVDAGAITAPKNRRIGSVAQEAPSGEEPLIEIVLAGDVERSRLLAKAETETDAHEIAAIHTRLADIEAHAAEARAAAILSGLGFDGMAQRRPASSFSGGWRMRVALAAALFARPDILLLDEPTNYLDLEGTLWLENFVARYRGTVIVISHDRDLLNRCTDSILHLEARRLTFYRGNFDSFERQRSEKLALAGKAQQKQEAQRKHLQAFVDRFRAKATKARQAQSRIKMLERMRDVSIAVDSATLPIRLPAPQKLLASPILRIEDGAAGYAPSEPVLQQLDLRIDQDDRIALLGANGNGKSTFAKLLAGRLPWHEGEIVRAPAMRVALFAQHQLEDLRPAETPVEHVRRLMPSQPEARVRGRVAQMGLDTARMDTKAADLSGGEKARLLLGLIAYDGPQLLILDEPTNHLDMDARETLMMALNDFSGAVILISHDRHLIEAVAERLWLVRDGRVLPYDGDMEDYRSEVLTGRRPNRKPARQDQTPTPIVTGQERRKAAAGRRQTLAPLVKKIKEIEALMANLQKSIQAIDSELATKVLYETQPEKAAHLSRRRSDTEKRLIGLEEEWLDLSSQLESESAAGAG